jgi:GxxExxY protein
VIDAVIGAAKRRASNWCNYCRDRRDLVMQKLQHFHARFSRSRTIPDGPNLAPHAGMFIDPSTFSPVTRKIIGAAIEVHQALGPGLLESIYQSCLQRELTVRKLRFDAQRSIPIVYKGLTLDASYRIDLIVEDLVVVEVKSVAALAPIHEAQGLTYLRLTGCPAGLLINFNVSRLVDGVQRLVNPAAGTVSGKRAEGSTRGPA